MSIQYKSFANAVVEYCKEGMNGTAFISTLNNKSCQVVIKEGIIIAVIMGRIKGEAAIAEVEKVGIKGASFNERLHLPYSEDAVIKSNAAILGHADSAQNNNNVSEQSSNASEQSSGPIDLEALLSAEDHLDPEPATSSKKKVDSQDDISDDDLLADILNNVKGSKV